MEPKNYGLQLDPFIPDEDFLGGSTLSLETKYGSEVLVPDGDWSPYTPSTENQDTSTGDTFACVSFATTNAIEMLARRRFEQRPNLSDRFLAKLSGTIVGQGNSPKKVADTLRHSWTVNEPEWPDVDTVAEYYAEPKPELKTLAIARGAEFELGYQYITNTPAVIKEALKRSPVCIAVTAWLEKNGVYVRVPGTQENHLTTVIKVLPNGNYLCFDSFAPFYKEVHPDACKSVAMSYYLNRQIVVESAWQKFIKWVVRYLPQLTPQPVPASTVPATPPPAPEPKANKLEAFCLAIRQHEGWFPGSRSWRNNNPGNCRYSSQGYLKIYEPVTRDPQNFAMFKTYDTGWLYLQNLVKAKISANPKQTIARFFQVYAPAEDHNNPEAYALFVAHSIGLSPSDPMSKIV